jgi:hypothetical protein
MSMKKQVKSSHASHPGVAPDHNTLFVFWVISALLLIVIVALLRAAQ